MLSKEEVIDIISYCREHKMNRGARLEELGISKWNFYSAKRKYIEEELKSGNHSGEFLQLSGGNFVPASVSGAELEANPHRTVRGCSRVSDVEIECQTSRGGMLRIRGGITETMMATLLQNL